MFFVSRTLGQIGASASGIFTWDLFLMFLCFQGDLILRLMCIFVERFNDKVYYNLTRDMN